MVEGFPVSVSVSAPISHSTPPPASPCPLFWNGTLKCDGYSGLTLALEHDTLCFSPHTEYRHTHSWCCGQYSQVIFSLSNILTNNTSSDSDSHIIPPSWSRTHLIVLAWMCVRMILWASFTVFVWWLLWTAIWIRICVCVWVLMRVKWKTVRMR